MISFTEDRVEPGTMMGGPSLAEMLLSHTGELKLTDQQVVRLAAIARRAADRRTAERARFDSLRATFRADTAARRRAFGAQPGQPGPLAADMQRMRDQARVDLRDALVVLTPDQQAQAWEMRSLRGGPAPMARGARGAARMRWGPRR